MIRDARELDDAAAIQTQICVVGAGAAGITLALDLAAQGLDVVLLESGGREADDTIQALYQGEMAGIGDIGIGHCRGRQFGGSTNLWAGWCRLLEPEVFGERPWMGNTAWPIDRDALMPWYLRAHRTVDIGNLEYDPEAFAERLGKPLLPLAEPAGHTVYQYSPPTNFARKYEAALEASDKITVYLYANLVDFETNEAGTAITAVQGKVLDGPGFTVRADRVVLAMGGLETTRMLLAARGGQGIGNDHDHLGRYFMEHPHFYKSGYFLAPQDHDLSAYLGKPTVRTEPDALGEGPKDAPIRFALAVPAAWRAQERLGLMGITLREVDFETHQDKTGAIPSLIIRDYLHAAGALKLIAMDIRAEQRPDPESRITLSEARDALGTPRLHLEWRVGAEDHRQYTRSLELLGAGIAKAGVSRLWMPTDETHTFRARNYTGGCHHLGTTRMSAAPADGVVDADLKVHGVGNLYVASSSVFPSGGFANPTLTIVALAHRLAAHLGGL